MLLPDFDLEIPLGGKVVSEIKKSPINLDYAIDIKHKAKIWFNQHRGPQTRKL